MLPALFAKVVDGIFVLERDPAFRVTLLAVSAKFVLGTGQWPVFAESLAQAEDRFPHVLVGNASLHQLVHDHRLANVLEAVDAR